MTGGSQSTSAATSAAKQAQRARTSISEAVTAALGAVGRASASGEKVRANPFRESFEPALPSEACQELEALGFTVTSYPVGNGGTTFVNWSEPKETTPEPGDRLTAQQAHDRGTASFQHRLDAALRSITTAIESGEVHPENWKPAVNFPYFPAHDVLAELKRLGFEVVSYAIVGQPPAIVVIPQHMLPDRFDTAGATTAEDPGLVTSAVAASAKVTATLPARVGAILDQVREVASQANRANPFTVGLDYVPYSDVWRFLEALGYQVVQPGTVGSDPTVVRWSEPGEPQEGVEGLTARQASELAGESLDVRLQAVLTEADRIRDAGGSSFPLRYQPAHDVRAALLERGYGIQYAFWTTDPPATIVLPVASE